MKPLIATYIHWSEKLQYLLCDKSATIAGKHIRIYEVSKEDGGGRWFYRYEMNGEHHLGAIWISYKGPHGSEHDPINMFDEENTVEERDAFHKLLMQAYEQAMPGFIDRMIAQSEEQYKDLISEYLKSIDNARKEYERRVDDLKDHIHKIEKELDFATKRIGGFK